MALNQSQKAARQKVLDLRSKILAAQFKSAQEKEKEKELKRQLAEHRATTKSK
jgi:hypothetical protein